MLQFNAFKCYLIPSYYRENVAVLFHTYSINIPSFSKKYFPEEVHNTILHFAGTGTAHASSAIREIGVLRPFFERCLILIQAVHPDQKHF
jgi:hypothetical protein